MKNLVTPRGENDTLMESKYKFEAKDFEDIVTGYKNRKPNQYSDLSSLAEMGGSVICHRRIG